MILPRYLYRAEVVSVYDGDTITVDIDLGMRIKVRGEKVRLFGINTPELRGDDKPQGLLARDHLRSLINAREVVIETHKDKKGKYGRYLATVWVQETPGEWLDVNKHLVAKGFAKFVTY